MTCEEVSHGLKRGELIQVLTWTYCVLLLLILYYSVPSMDKVTCEALDIVPLDTLLVSF